MNFRHIDDHGDHYQVDYISADPLTAPANGDVTTLSHVFAGAKVVTLLDRYESEFHIPSFDKAVDFGWFYFLTKPIFFALDFLNGLLGQFRPGHHGVHRLREGAVLPAGQLLLPLHEQDEAAGAEDDGAAGASQGRPAEDAAGDDGAVSARRR